MNIYEIALLCTIAFIAGCVLTLVVSERAMTARERRQAVRRRELTALSESVEQRLSLLVEAEDGYERDYERVA